MLLDTGLLIPNTFCSGDNIGYSFIIMNNGDAYGEIIFENERIQYNK